MRNGKKKKMLKRKAGPKSGLQVTSTPASLYNTF